MTPRLKQALRATLRAAGWWGVVVALAVAFILTVGALAPVGAAQ